MPSSEELRAQAESAIDAMLAKPGFEDLGPDRASLIDTLYTYLRVKDSYWPWDWWTANRLLETLRDAFGQTTFAKPPTAPPPLAESTDPGEPLSDDYVEAVAALTIDVIVLVSTILPAGRIRRGTITAAVDDLHELIRANPGTFRAFAQRLVSLRRIDLSNPSVATAEEIYDILSTALSELNSEIGLQRILGVIFTSLSPGEIAEIAGYMLLSAALRLIPWLGVVRYTVSVGDAVRRVLQRLAEVEALQNGP